MQAGLADFGRGKKLSPQCVGKEKDALSGIFEDALDPYGVTLNVGRGFDGWDPIHNAAQRLRDEDVILYFVDFDPSGEDMVRSPRERLADQGSVRDHFGDVVLDLLRRDYPE